jgi:hypothetical protein
VIECLFKALSSNPSIDLKKGKEKKRKSKGKWEIRKTA